MATGATASDVVKVDLGGNLVAHTSNSAAQGPRVEVRVVIDGETRPGIVATLDRAHTQVSKQGLIFNLTKADTAAPVLTAFLNGVTTPYPPPKATEAPTTCVSEVQQVEAGGGLLVDLTMSSKGPKAVLHNADPAGNWSQTLDRTHPQGPSDHSVRIVNPSGAHPFLEWKTQGGNDVPCRDPGRHLPPHRLRRGGRPRRRPRGLRSRRAAAPPLPHPGLIRHRSHPSRGGRTPLAPVTLLAPAGHHVVARRGCFRVPADPGGRRSVFGGSTMEWAPPFRHAFARYTAMTGGGSSGRTRSIDLSSAARHT
ncbi:hypothetical protein AB0B78_13385 [Streptomyces sp. NPDC040724]|uniref:hypothetical protein n=1 Tax=Streptomyces sp. NPDC040724 TaxID=3155612 RepID=UPI00340BAECF